MIRQSFQRNPTGLSKPNCSQNNFQEVDSTEERLAFIKHAIEHLQSVRMMQVVQEAVGEPLSEMRIFIKTETGKTLTLDGLKPTDSTDKARAMIYDKRNRLTCGASPVAGGTLADNDVQKDSVLMETSRLEAGGKRARQVADENNGKQPKADKNQQLAEAQRVLRGMMFEM